MRFFRRKNVLELRSGESGLEYRENGQVKWSAAWSDISRVIAYQTDAFTVDTRWLRFETDGSSLDVNEDTPGYYALESAVPDFLRVRPGWFAEVVRTAFERNETLVYDRSTDGSQTD